jgi:hypothetical protein
VRLPGWVRRHPGYVLVGACLALGFLSLALPSAPTYDPWSWILWGREVLHGDLVTSSGPSWKPLPMLFTVPFGLFGDAAPYLWVAVARAGALLGLALAVRLAWRLSGGGVTGILGGLVAAGGLFISSYFLRTVALGNSEGMMIAAVLAGFDRHLSGRRDQALLCGLAAALLRPEVWLFVGAYSLYALIVERRLWKLIVGMWTVTFALWFLPELWGSGTLLRSADRAATPNPNSPAFAAHPWLALLQKWRPVLVFPMKVGIVAALVVAIVVFVRRRAETATLALAAFVIAWVALIAVMTERGFSGNPRYLMPATAMACVLAGVGWAWILRALDSLLARFISNGRALQAVRVGALVLIVAAVAPYALSRAKQLRVVFQQLHYQAIKNGDLDKAVASVGGRAKILACGHPSTGSFEVPAVAWHIDVHIDEVSNHPQYPGLVFQTRATRRGKPAPVLPGTLRYRQLTNVGTWQTVTAGCFPESHLAFPGPAFRSSTLATP